MNHQFPGDHSAASDAFGRETNPLFFGGIKETDEIEMEYLASVVMWVCPSMRSGKGRMLREEREVQSTEESEQESCKRKKRKEGKPGEERVFKPSRRA